MKIIFSLAVGTFCIALISCASTPRTSVQNSAPKFVPYTFTNCADMANWHKAKYAYNQEQIQLMKAKFSANPTRENELAKLNAGANAAADEADYAAMRSDHNCQ